MNDDPGSCCEIDHGCVFAKVLLARQADCQCARRQALGERVAVGCGSPVARAHCGTLAALLRERMRFALKLPAAGPLTHQQAMRLQCGGMTALHGHLRTDAPAHIDGTRPAPDLHRLVGAARQRHGSLTELPWAQLAPAVVAWLPRRRRGPPA